MILSSLVHLLRMWWRFDQTMRELALLDDRQLADLGLTRHDIVATAWQQAEAV